MLPVITLCPNAKVPVWTLLLLRREELEALDGERFFRCQLCGKAHGWNRTNAWLAEGVAPAAARKPPRYVFKKERDALKRAADRRARGAAAS